VGQTPFYRNSRPRRKAGLRLDRGEGDGDGASHGHQQKGQGD
jgi:hypothetical protein